MHKCCENPKKQGSPDPAWTLKASAQQEQVANSQWVQRQHSLDTTISAELIGIESGHLGILLKWYLSKLLLKWNTSIKLIIKKSLKIESRIMDKSINEARINGL